MGQESNQDGKKVVETHGTKARASSENVAKGSTPFGSAGPPKQVQRAEPAGNESGTVSQPDRTPLPVVGPSGPLRPDVIESVPFGSAGPQTPQASVKPSGSGDTSAGDQSGTSQQGSGDAGTESAGDSESSKE